jgi:hypothetical protein
MRFLNKNFKGVKSGYIIYGFVAILVLYVVFLFFYLKVVGVYGVAVIKEAVPTTEGILYSYEFFYNGISYSGRFSGFGKHHIGDRYFVSFSRKNPDKNLLQYNRPVPQCLTDSFNVFWQTYPECPGSQ